MANTRDDFEPKIKELLAKRVDYRCSNPVCRKQTIGPNTDLAKTINIGVAAHITAAAKGGKRYDATLTPEERKSFNNGIWLCQNCGKLIDSDEALYSTELINSWKSSAEKLSLQEIEGSTEHEDSSGKLVWVDKNTREKINPNKIHKQGIFKTKMDGSSVFAEYKLPDGKTTYCEYDIDTNAVNNIQYPYPLSEYKLDIPLNLVLKEESGDTMINHKIFQATIIYLKWGKRVNLLYDQGVLIDIDINTKSFIDHTNKIIHVYDIADEN